MKKTLFFILVLAAVPSKAAYIANRDFLSTGHGSRAIGMGEAYVGVADDSSAMFWNPAGLTQMKSDEISLDYANRFDNLATEANMHYVWRSRKAMWGIGYVGNYVKDIPITQSLTESELADITSGSFAPGEYSQKTVMDHAILMSYSRPITPESPHFLGATVKGIYKDMLGMVHGYGTAVDIGYMYTSFSGNVRFGTNVQNVASLVSYSGTMKNLDVRATATESYIPNIKTGFGYLPTWRLFNGKMLFAFDVNMLTSFDVDDYRAGVEYSFGDVIALRAGKVFGRQDDSSQDYTLGIGVLIKNLAFDFSFVSNELGDTTRGTLSYRLGGDYYTPSQYKR